MSNQLDYDKIGNFVTTAMIIINAPIHSGVIDNVFDFIEKEFIGKERDALISALAERVDDIEDVDSKARLLRFIQEHRKDDTDGKVIAI